MSVGEVGGTGGIDPIENYSGGIPQTQQERDDSRALDRALNSLKGDLDHGATDKKTIYPAVKEVVKAWNQLILDTNYQGYSHNPPTDTDIVIENFHAAIQCMKSQDDDRGVFKQGFITIRDEPGSNKNYIANINDDYWDPSKPRFDQDSMVSLAMDCDSQIPEYIRNEWPQ